MDAVYIGTVHTTHAALAHAALDAGKAVLCEKPLGVTVAETEELIAHAEAARLSLVEAFKYRFGPFAGRLRRMIETGVLGELTDVEASIGFAAESREGRLFDPATAGGAILDGGRRPATRSRLSQFRRALRALRVRRGAYASGPARRGVPSGRAVRGMPRRWEFRGARGSRRE